MEEEKGKRRTKKSVLEAPGSPWDVQKELPGAMVDIGPAPSGLNRPPPLPTSLRLGDSEDLRAKKRSYSGSDTPLGRRIKSLI